MTWEQSLAANYTDGIVILHRGRIVYERYFGALAPDRQHIAFSVTKSFVATVAAMLIAEGKLDENATVARYLPEFQGRGMGDATIRQLLDMTTGPDYTEDYADPSSPVWASTRAGGFLARPPGYDGPESFFDYLLTLRKARPHGEQFAYKTVNTDTLNAVLRRVTGQTLSNLLSERIFSRLGAEQDAYFTVDPTGAEFAGGGFSLTLRDLARFGETMRLDGRFNGQQIVPKAVVDDIRRGGDRESVRPSRLRHAARRQLSQHVVGAAQRARRLQRARHSRPSFVHRSEGGDGDRALRLAPFGRERQLRRHVVAGLSGRRRVAAGNALGPIPHSATLESQECTALHDGRCSLDQTLSGHCSRLFAAHRPVRTPAHRPKRAVTPCCECQADGTC